MTDDQPLEGTVQAQYDWLQTPPSVAIIETIATLENTPSTDLAPIHGFTLADEIDSEALDTLVTSGGPLSLSVSIGEYDVDITGETLSVRTD